MQTFRSEVFPDLFKEKINYSNKIIFIGSCFAENIGLKLLNLKFPILINPFGIVYNPSSVLQSIEYILEQKVFAKKDLEYYNDKWISFDHHGRFSATNSEEVLQKINGEITKAIDILKNASHLFITLGTSWVFKYKKTSKIVANCHKFPAAEFDHYSLSVSDIIDSYQLLLEKLHQLNPQLKIIFTVSPVRHWKNGPENNQLSKSVLIVSVHELAKKNDFVSYFPSYELMMDDLRDYRFYADDLFHPNQTGIDYIWEKFKVCFLSDESIETSMKVDKVLKSMQHKVFYPNTLTYKKFLESNLKLMDEIRNKHTYLSFNEEIEYFKNELLKYFNQ